MHTRRRPHPRPPLLTGNQGATARNAAAPHYYQRGGISMTEDEAYKVHIQYTFNAFCKVVIRRAPTAIDIILTLRRKWEREIPLDYPMNE